MRGIAEMFDELSSYGQDLADLGLAERARQQLSYNARWKRDNPTKVRAAQRRHREKNREHLREVWKRNSQHYRDRKRQRA